MQQDCLGFSRETWGNGSLTPKSELPLPSSDGILPRPGVHPSGAGEDKILRIPDMGGDWCSFSVIL